MTFWYFNNKSLKLEFYHFLYVLTIIHIINHVFICITFAYICLRARTQKNARISVHAHKDIYKLRSICARKIFGACSALKEREGGRMEGRGGARENQNKFSCVNFVN